MLIIACSRFIDIYAPAHGSRRMVESRPIVGVRHACALDYRKMRHYNTKSGIRPTPEAESFQQAPSVRKDFIAGKWVMQQRGNHVDRNQPGKTS